MTKKIIFFLTIAISISCLWDSDSLSMEKQKFPETTEIISGKFLQHSKLFYKWRIQNCEKKLKVNPNQENLYNNLAVAYSKLDSNKKAIEIILTKNELYPGKYETYANLGTFYIHDKQFKKGLRAIKKAIVINPKAHFGREIFQQLLVEYVISKHPNKIQLPIDTTNLEEPYLPSFIYDQKNFHSYIWKNHLHEEMPSTRTHEFPYSKLEDAIKGVSGMIKFGNHQSPILLEALGDLMNNRGVKSPNRHLAAMCYLKASYHSPNDSIAKLYRMKAQRSLAIARGKYKTLTALELQFKKEIQTAKVFVNQIKIDENTWILAGKDPEKEFAKKYYKE